MSDYTNESQQRLIKTFLVLFGHEINGLAPGQIAQAIGSTPSNATRDLFNLQKAGLVEQVQHSGFYRITPMIGQKALAIHTSIDQAERRIAETRQRYSRLPDGSSAEQTIQHYSR